MVPLPVVVRHELVDRTDQAPFAEQDQLIQALLVVGSPRAEVHDDGDLLS